MQLRSSRGEAAGPFFAGRDRIRVMDAGDARVCSPFTAASKLGPHVRAGVFGTDNHVAFSPWPRPDRVFMA
jgi:hypothetical protein